MKFPDFLQIEMGSTICPFDDILRFLYIRGKFLTFTVNMQENAGKCIFSVVTCIIF